MEKWTEIESLADAGAPGRAPAFFTSPHPTEAKPGLRKEIPDPESRATKLALITVFLGGFAAFVSHAPYRQKHAHRLDLPPADLFLLATSTLRLGRLAAYDRVFEPIRAPFAETRPDDYGASQTTAPKGHGARRSLGELLSCPICAGTWIAAGLVYSLHLFPGPTRLFMTIMSTIGLGEMLNALTEYLTWQGEVARKHVGED